MRRPHVRAVTALAVLAVLPLLSAESCALKPANIKVVSVAITPQPGRALPLKSLNGSQRALPATKSDGGRYVVPANTPGTFVVTFTSDTFFTLCTLDLDGRSEREVAPIGSGQWIIKQPTGALAPYRSVSGSLTCTPTAGVVEPAVSTFEVVARPMARLAASPSTLDFGGVLLGSRAPARTVKVTNAGDDTTIVRSLAGYAPGYNVSASIKDNTIVRPGQSFSLTISFTPDKVGPAKGVIGVVLAGGDIAYLVGVTGVGGTSYAPAFVASSTWLKFGELNTGASQELPVTVRNTGLNALQVGWLSMTGNDPGSFAVASEDCTPRTLAAGDSCTVTVRFTATRGGYANAILRFGDNATGNPHEITLTGDGLAPAPTAAPQPQPSSEYPYPPP